MKYRPEIDGLRSFAVVPVILQHAGFSAFSGGFSGVDVFFVISGYLITTIIISELAEGTYSTANFYKRRARRILPALFFILAASAPFAWMWLPASEIQAFGRSVVAAIFFSSNIFFWRTGLGPGIDNIPLVHTWSLAVEEQFYIFFPLLLLALWRFGRSRVLLTMILLFACSLAIAQWGTQTKPVAAYFLLPTRAWELLIGSFAAFYLTGRTTPIPQSPFAQAASSLGLALICYTVFAFGEHTPFPGYHALVPTLGAALVILFAVKGTLAHTILSLRPCVWIGLVSYSAYLWHQPVLVFARKKLGMDLSPEVAAALCVLTFALAYLSWRFVEQPFRQGGRFSGSPAGRAKPSRPEHRRTVSAESPSGG